MRATFGLLAPTLLMVAVSAKPALKARQVSYDDTCQGDQKAKAEKAFGDLGTLANAILNGPKLKQGDTEIEYRQSTAYTNYFEDNDYGTVQAMHQAIYNNRLPADENHSESYKVTVKCGSKANEAECNENIAATNPVVGGSEIVLCDAFFEQDSVQTVNDLDSKTREDWCKQKPIFNNFFVAGQVLYHEMTHLDVVGAQAGLTLRPAYPDKPDDPARSHGTVDVYNIGGTFDRQQYADENGKQYPIYSASRLLKLLWEDFDSGEEDYKPLAQRVENAESYAASALEWYFQVLCEFPEIDVD